MRKYVILLSCLWLFLLTENVKAEENEYVLAAATASGYTVLDTYSSYYRAERAFAEEKENYNNLVISYDGKVLKMERGIVEFRVDEGCTLTLSYERDHRQEGYINGCYAIDALYIDSDEEEVSFLLAGDRGTIAAQDVILHPYESLQVRTSAYTVRKGMLYHEIKSQLKTDFYFANIAIGDAPEYLQEEKTYYSYDGHYFFDSFVAMSEALQNDDMHSAVNAERPYYAYFQYLSNRSISHYESGEIEKYFANTLSYNSRLDFFRDVNRDNLTDAINESQYVGEIGNFFAYQYQYGANALMMLSLSMNETGNGKSALAYNRNNLFGHAAYDSDVERNASRYLSVKNSIRSHAKYYVSRSYSSVKSNHYHGSFFGDKRSGMNVAYASDPYWGEKAAQHYYRLDKALGGKDNGAYALGISESSYVRIYSDAEGEEILYTIRNISPLSFVILAKSGDYYKIQTDPSFDADYRYDFEKEVGYIAAEDIQTILNEDRIHQETFVTVHFDAAGGNFDGQEKLSIAVGKGRIPSVPSPEKDGYRFLGFDKEITAAENETTYMAQYKEIKEIHLLSFPTVVEKGLPLDLRGAKLRLVYADGSREELAVHSDFVKGYDSALSGKQTLIVHYAGKEVETVITVSEEQAILRKSVGERVEACVKKLAEKENVILSELSALREDIIRSHYLLDMEQLSALDRAMYAYAEGHVSYAVDDRQHLQAGISGLHLAIGITEKDFDSFLLPNVFGVKITSVSRSEERILLHTAKAYGYEVVKSFRLNLLRNARTVEAENPFVLSVKVDKPQNVYTVYYLDADQNVFLCRSVRSENYVRFIAPGNGSYLLVEKESNNTYDLKDSVETVNETNIDNTVFARFFRRMCIAGFGTFALLQWVLYRKFEERKRREWNAYRKLLLSEATAQDARLKN